MTPCKHMFHSDCLDVRIGAPLWAWLTYQQTWFNTAKVVSCPMCRRDLFLLECLTKMVPEKTLEAAMTMWMSLQV